MNTQSHKAVFTASDAMGAGVSRTAVIEDSFYEAKNYAVASIVRASGKTEEVGLASKYNSRTSAGATFWYTQISGTATTAVASYLALGATSLTIGLGDTTLASEITTSGLVRKVGTVGGYVAPTTTSGAGQNFSYTVSATWTASATQAVNAAAVLTAVTVGTLVLEANFGATITLNSGDSITLTWTISS